MKAAGDVSCLGVVGFANVGSMVLRPYPGVLQSTEYDQAFEKVSSRLQPRPNGK